MFIEIPTYENETWGLTSFYTREEFKDFVKSVFKEPGKYNFTEVTKIFNAEGRKFQKQRYYCAAPIKTKDFIAYWDDQKNKCRNGVIVKDGDETWYVTRDYYMWLNFLPIYDKEEKRFDFAKIRDAQYHMALYEHLAELNWKHAIILKKRQIASEQPHSEPILTIDGWKTMGDVHEGDYLWNPDGTLTQIVAKLTNGLSDVYEFKFADGRSTRCGIEHNWLVYDRVKKEEIVLNTKQLLDLGLYSSPVRSKTKNGKKEYKVARFGIKYTNPINFLGSSALPVDPYVLGCLLGDGSINGSSVNITTEDVELVNHIQERVGYNYNIKSNFKSNNTYRYGISYKDRFAEECKKYTNGKFGCNPLIRGLKELGLKDATTYTKFIPKEYLEAPVPVRIDLLKGLMDTDGFINTKGKDINYTTTCKQLADDVAYLTRSLGIKTVISVKNHKDINAGKTFYRVRLSGHIPFNIFKLTRKCVRFETRKDGFPLCNLLEINKLDYQEESSCVIVDNPNHLYITKDFIVTHNSYFHMAKLINQWVFEPGAVLKIGASLKDYINEKGSWKFLNEYRNFLNEHTAWYRPAEPDKVGAWNQQIKVRIGGRDSYKGLKSTINLYSFEKDPTHGVGGPVTYFFHEEAGIAPKMDDTYGFMKPALKSGHIITGQFIAAGSVGDLDQCEPMKEYILHPEENGFFGVESNLVDKDGTIGITGLFIPEQWSMPPYIDQYGNSKVEEALEALETEFAKMKKELDPAAYQLTVSQQPRNIEEAFATRKVSVFPPHLVARQMQRIQDKEYPVEYLELSRDSEGKIIDKPSRKIPIMDFPISKKTEDKEGVICIYERPAKNPTFGMYYASVDPVGEGKAEHIDNMLYTPTGRKRIGDIQTGDKVIGSNGQAVNIIGVYPQGVKKMCNITFNDGHSIKVCEDHLWSVKLNGGTKEYITLSVKDLLDKNKTITYNGIGRNIKKKYTISTYYKDKQNRNKWSIPIVKPINFDFDIKLPINPYLLGLLLGDGGLSQRSIRFSTIDTELIKSITHMLENDLLIKKVKNSNCDYSIVTKVGSRNLLTKKLKELGLKGKKSENKFIPQNYMYAEESNRLLLLQGLMDTDGSYSNHGAEFYSSSKKLAYQVVELVQSLGGIAKIRCKKTTHLDSYIVRVLLPEHLNPFILNRKRKIYKPSKVFSRYITNIEYTDDAEAVCISVDALNNLYVTEHALVTHNTTTSESLCSIYVYKNPVEVVKDDGNGKITSTIERDGIVASWCGRFDDLTKTHERLEILIEWYNAWTVVENNVALFIQYMISKKKQRYLVPKDMILFLKDIGANRNVFQEYGWKNVGTLFKGTVLSYGIEYLKEELDHETKPDGEIVKTIYGVERIPDIMLLKEMQAYRDGLNVDRLVTFCALIAFAKVQQSNRGVTKRIEVTKENLDNSQKFSKLNYSPFRHIGTGKNSSSMMKPSRNAFKNMK